MLTVHKKEKNFKCEECGKAFGEKAQLKKHERLHLFTYCAKCKDHFENIKQHNEEKHSKLKHSCDSCFKVFERSRDLDSHVKTKHSAIRSFFCDYCKKGFAEKFQIERHMKVHKRKFMCESKVKKEEEFSSNEFEIFNFNETDDRFSSELDIKEEDKSDDKEEQAYNNCMIPEVKIKEEEDEDLIKYDSDPINSIFADELDFKQESDDSTVTDSQKSHKNDHRCGKCKKVFDNKNALKKHSRKKHGNKFICDLCGSQFSHKFTARKHMESIHKKIKYECEICQKTFTFKNSKYTHIKVVHQKKRLHECQFCEKKFGVKYALTKHIEIVHWENPSDRKRHKCDLCGKNFSSHSGLFTHKKCVHEKVKRQQIVEHPCKICREPFKTSHHHLMHSIQVHLNGKKLKRICGYCKQEFELYDDFKTHLDSHVGLFICMICDKFYSDEQSLKSHKESHKEVDSEFRNYICDHCGQRLLTKLQLKVLFDHIWI